MYQIQISIVLSDYSIKMLCDFPSVSTIPCHQSMARPAVADGHTLQIWRAVVNAISISWISSHWQPTPDSPSAWAELITLHRKRTMVAKCSTQHHTTANSLRCKVGKRFETWTVRNLNKFGSLKTAVRELAKYTVPLKPSPSTTIS